MMIIMIIIIISIMIIIIISIMIMIIIMIQRALGIPHPRLDEVFGEAVISLRR